MNQLVQALTATSQQLKALTQSRGFYGGKSGKGKGKSSGKSKGKGKGFGKGKGPRASLGYQQRNPGGNGKGSGKSSTQAAGKQVINNRFSKTAAPTRAAVTNEDD